MNDYQDILQIIEANKNKFEEAISHLPQHMHRSNGILFGASMYKKIEHIKNSLSKTNVDNREFALNYNEAIRLSEILARKE